MIAKIPWTERKFNFDFPVSHLPCIYVRLEGTSTRIAEYIKDLSEEELKLKPNGKWSVKEHIGHLIDLEELHEGRLEDYRNKVKVLRAADMQNTKTNAANHNAIPVTTLLNKFHETRMHFLNQLEAMDETALSQSALHPRLQQPMRVVDMAFFVAEHDDQHLVCIQEIFATLNSDL
jgi:hypothetical protein